MLAVTDVEKMLRKLRDAEEDFIRELYQEIRSYITTYTLPNVIDVRERLNLLKMLFHKYLPALREIDPYTADQICSFLRLLHLLLEIICSDSIHNFRDKIEHFLREYEQYGSSLLAYWTDPKKAFELLRMFVAKEIAKEYAKEMKLEKRWGLFRHVDVKEVFTHVVETINCAIRIINNVFLRIQELIKSMEEISRICKELDHECDILSGVANNLIHFFRFVGSESYKRRIGDIIQELSNIKLRAREDCKKAIDELRVLRSELERVLREYVTESTEELRRFMRIYKLWCRVFNKPEEEYWFLPKELLYEDTLRPNTLVNLRVIIERSKLNKLCDELRLTSIDITLDKLMDKMVDCIGNHLRIKLMDFKKRIEEQKGFFQRSLQDIISVKEVSSKLLDLVRVINPSNLEIRHDLLPDIDTLVKACDECTTLSNEVESLIAITGNPSNLKLEILKDPDKILGKIGDIEERLKNLSQKVSSIIDILKNDVVETKVQDRVLRVSKNVVSCIDILREYIERLQYCCQKLENLRKLSVSDSALRGIAEQCSSEIFGKDPDTLLEELYKLRDSILRYLDGSIERLNINLLRQYAEKIEFYVNCVEKRRETYEKLKIILLQSFR